jgi:hypothetical protein
MPVRDADSGGIDSVDLALLKSLGFNFTTGTAVTLLAGVTGLAIKVVSQQITNQNALIPVGMTIAYLIVYLNRNNQRGGVDPLKILYESNYIISEISTKLSSINDHDKQIISYQLAELLNKLNSKDEKLFLNDVEKLLRSGDYENLDIFLSDITTKLQVKGDHHNHAAVVPSTQKVKGDHHKHAAVVPSTQKVKGGYKPKKSRSKRRTKKSRRNKKSRRSRRY